MVAAVSTIILIPTIATITITMAHSLHSFSQRS